MKKAETSFLATVQPITAMGEVNECDKKIISNIE
jgi:hypothetical protein